MDFGVKLDPDLSKGNLSAFWEKMEVLHGFVCPKDSIHNYYVIGTGFF